jgi:ribosomal protein L7/L12
MDILLIIGVVIVALLVIVGVVVSRGSSDRRPSAPLPVVPASPDLTTEIDRLLVSGNKIGAIKAYRDATGASLAVAKDRIETWVIGAPTPLPDSAAAPSFRTSLPPDVVTEIDRLVVSERPIEAIKLLRQHTGLGLAESKSVIDFWILGT